MSNWRTIVRNPKNLGAINLRGGGIAKRGTGAALKTGGRAALWHGGPHNRGRTNLLEELGRVEGERSDPNRRAEISRVHGELNRGYATGGVVREIRKGAKRLGEAAKKHVARKEAAKVQAGKDEIRQSDMGYAKGGKAKKGKKWMQKVSASIKKRGTKGKCTPITKPGCTGRAKALAKTFKKIAAKRKA